LAPGAGDGVRPTPSSVPGHVASSAGPWPCRVEISLPSTIESLAPLRAFLAGLLTEAVDEAVIREFQLVLQEACSNAIRHAASCKECGPLGVSFDVTPDGITIEVRDHGPGFTPLEVPSPLNGDLKEGGYGVFIIQELMDRVETRKEGGMFVLSMTRAFPNGHPGLEGGTS
jgi:serine/threonine-protein kinase RsbW